MGNIHDAFPSNYLKASDLKSTQPVVIIDRIEFEPVGRQKEMKPILYLVGKEKGIVLNKTNANNIASLAGTTETDEWPGVRIKLYATHVEFQGETVEAIRIKAAPPQAANGNGAKRAATPMPVSEPEPPPLTDDDIPFAWLLPLVLPALGLFGLAG